MLQRRVAREGGDAFADSAAAVGVEEGASTSMNVTPTKRPRTDPRRWHRRLVYNSASWTPLQAFRLVCSSVGGSWGSGGRGETPEARVIFMGRQHERRGGRAGSLLGRLRGDGGRARQETESWTPLTEPLRFPANSIQNRKYNGLTLVPSVLIQQFRFFFNFFFLMVALLQLFPILRVGLLITYLGPLFMVLSVTIIKEGTDDVKRGKRDKEVNTERYLRLLPSGRRESVPASELRVGDFVFVEKDRRVPADLIFLRAVYPQHQQRVEDESGNGHDSKENGEHRDGSVFVRTDQLDGETDWKLKRPAALTHSLRSDRFLFAIDGEMRCPAPQKDIYAFSASLTVRNRKALLCPVSEKQTQQRHSPTTEGPPDILTGELYSPVPDSGPGPAALGGPWHAPRVSPEGRASSSPPAVPSVSPSLSGGAGLAGPRSSQRGTATGVTHAGEGGASRLEAQRLGKSLETELLPMVGQDGGGSQGTHPMRSGLAVGTEGGSASRGLREREKERGGDAAAGAGAGPGARRLAGRSRSPSGRRGESAFDGGEGKGKRESEVASGVTSSRDGGTAGVKSTQSEQESGEEEKVYREFLELENAIWASCVVASGEVLGMVVHTGSETRSSMNSSQGRVKTSKVDEEVNRFTKFLFWLVVGLALIMTGMRPAGFTGVWYIVTMRFVLLFSSIIPISMRVNLDMAKSLFAALVQRDQEIPGTVPRTSSIPEDLGRIGYVLTDKTGTLTANEMVMKKVHLGCALFHAGSPSGSSTGPQPEGTDGLALCKRTLVAAFLFDDATLEDREREKERDGGGAAAAAAAAGRIPRSFVETQGIPVGVRQWRQLLLIKRAFLCLAVCNNVTPLQEESADPTLAAEGVGGRGEEGRKRGREREREKAGANKKKKKEVSFQASSPDEVALASFAADCGMKLVARTPKTVSVEDPHGRLLHFSVLALFPFSSETKRMSVLVQLKSQQQSSSSSSSYATGGGGETEGVGGSMGQASLLGDGKSAGGDRGERGVQEQGGTGTSLISNDGGPIFFFVKGAESVLLPLMKQRGAAWVPEEVENFAREGLRTLVCAYREVRAREASTFLSDLSEARGRLDAGAVRRVVSAFEGGLEALALTGVEDRLQDRVRLTLEKLLEASVRVWMLTGDKVETAKCVAVSAGLKGPRQRFFTISTVEVASEIARRKAVKAVTGGTAGAGRGGQKAAAVRPSKDREKEGQGVPGMGMEAVGDEDLPGSSSAAELEVALDFLRSFAAEAEDRVLVLDGAGLGLFLTDERATEEFVRAACRAPSVVCCRCSPTQKAAVVRAVQRVVGERCLAVGDGGNDVGMIQAADVGVGILGKEGKQASLAADYSIMQFRFLLRLLLWHGRNSYLGSARLAQFVMHRGLVLAVIQALFSAVFHFSAISFFQGWMLVGYGTYYTMLPVFSLVLDRDVSETNAFVFPALYAGLRKNRALSLKTFCQWVFLSFYQGASLFLSSVVLFDDHFLHIVAIVFTALILTELLNVATEIRNWTRPMLWAQTFSVLVYVFSWFLLPNKFLRRFARSGAFFQRVLLMVASSWGPAHLCLVIDRWCHPPEFSKLLEEEEEDEEDPREAEGEGAQREGHTGREQGGGPSSALSLLPSLPGFSAWGGSTRGPAGRGQWRPLSTVASAGAPDPSSEASPGSTGSASARKKRRKNRWAAGERTRRRRAEALAAGGGMSIGARLQLLWNSAGNWIDRLSEIATADASAGVRRGGRGAYRPIGVAGALRGAFPSGSAPLSVIGPPGFSASATGAGRGQSGPRGGIGAWRWDRDGLGAVGSPTVTQGRGLRDGDAERGHAGGRVDLGREERQVRSANQSRLRERWESDDNEKGEERPGSCSDSAGGSAMSGGMMSETESASSRAASVPDV
uniref:Uncharacterized protein n=1 Tax=Chromera velia CCMP2878 TaxID=1169474 RepID=A0A0G4HI61_9ALVE|eukprot:Cvel_6949.t1-p1 / transcript=Cvel_6949.t1 / gene=Cvel_6949 / organism=Chromera_velia_CCMP2878 / gene_product=Probable phospholipid-transporting ATPase IIB, putative / transcript_product=Probable phospholipid-transporting ATPase IIB, putative / location=Cvel_scaffold352:43663-59052(+) / protein_length=1882 / sequence_SO=supercontig / SO=protein_coding / is_pseudo=false